MASKVIELFVTSTENPIIEKGCGKLFIYDGAGHNLEIENYHTLLLSGCFNDVIINNVTSIEFRDKDTTIKNLYCKKTQNFAVEDSKIYRGVITVDGTRCKNQVSNIIFN